MDIPLSGMQPKDHAHESYPDLPSLSKGQNQERNGAHWTCTHKDEIMIPMFPKPKDVKKVRPSVKVFPNGREVLDLKTKAGMDEYQRRRMAMWERQGRRCALQITDICKERHGRWPQDEITFDHEAGRTSGKRDDRIEVNGKPQNASVCAWCNSEKSSRRIAYLDCP